MIFPVRVLGSASAKRMSSGLATGRCACRHGCAVHRGGSGLRVHAAFQRDKSDQRLAFQFIGPADDGGFRDVVIAHQRALDFRGAEAMAGDVQHVIDAAHDPEIAVLVLPAPSPVK